MDVHPIEECDFMLQKPDTGTNNLCDHQRCASFGMGYRNDDQTYPLHDT